MNEQNGVGGRIINSVAPIRVCDNGGWTDTWFSEYGRIFNIAVYPYAEVQIEVLPAGEAERRVEIHAENFGERYTLDMPRQTPDYDRHPLIEAAIERMGVPDEMAVRVTIFSDAPAGASTGTSAAVTVALIGALDALTPGRMTPHEVAYTAHAVEVEMLHQQCGIQDQLCCAYGGINYIEMFSYPHAAVSPIQIPNATWWELERRLVLIFLGKSHSSSDVHRKVIADLESSGPEDRRIERLRQTAGRSRDALFAGDFSALGAAMSENTEAQRGLHPELVSPDAERVIAAAKAAGAVGWKVNGAGGDGGSITILTGARSSERRALIRDITQESPLFQHIPTYLSRFGLRTWAG